MYHMDCGDGNMSVYTRPNSPSVYINCVHFVYLLYLNKAGKKVHCKKIKINFFF